MIMKILVFVKQVPNTDDVQLDPVTGNLRREGVQSILNPLDANAVEVALDLKARYGGTICAVSMGPPQAGAVLRRALAMGCDEAYLLSDRTFGGADTLATSYTLAKAAEKIGAYDLLLFGRHAIDGDTAQTGPAVAAWLGIPQITLATSVSAADGWVICQRALGDTVQTVKAKMPAAVTICGDINTPRYPSLVQMLHPTGKMTTVWNAEDLGCEPEKIGISGSPSATKEVFVPEQRKTDVHFFSGEMEKIVQSFVDMLHEEHII